MAGEGVSVGVISGEVNLVYASFDEAVNKVIDRVTVLSDKIETSMARIEESITSHLDAATVKIAKFESVLGALDDRFASLAGSARKAGSEVDAAISSMTGGAVGSLSVLTGAVQGAKAELASLPKAVATSVGAADVIASAGLGGRGSAMAERSLAQDFRSGFSQSGLIGSKAWQNSFLQQIPGKIDQAAQKFLVSPARNLMQLSGRLSMYVSAPTLAALGYGLFEGANLQQAAAFSATQLPPGFNFSGPKGGPYAGGNTQYLQDLGLNLSTRGKIPIDPKAIIKAMYYILSGGLRGPDGNLLSPTQLIGNRQQTNGTIFDEVLKFSESQQLDPTAAINALIPMANVFGVPGTAKGYKGMLNEVAKAAAISRLSPSDLATNVGRIGAYTQSQGLDMAQTLSLFTYVSGLLPPRQAATGIETMMQNMRQHPDQWNQLAKLAASQGFNEAGGLSYYDNSGNAQNAFTMFKSLADYFKFLKESGNYTGKTKEITDYLMRQLFPSIRGTQASTYFLQGTGSVASNAQQIAGAANSNFYESQYLTLLKTDQSKLTFIANWLKGITSSLGTSKPVGAILDGIATGIGKLGDAINRMPARDKLELVLKLLGTAAIFPAMLAVGSLVEGIGLLAIAFGLLTSPIGLGLMAVLGGPTLKGIQGLAKASHDAGGGMTGLVTAIVRLGQNLGLISNKDALNFLHQLGINTSKIDFKKVDADLKDVKKSAHELWSKIHDLLTTMKTIVSFMVDHKHAVMDVLIAWRSGFAEIIGKNLIRDLQTVVATIQGAGKSAETSATKMKAIGGAATADTKAVEGLVVSDLSLGVASDTALLGGGKGILSLFKKDGGLMSSLRLATRAGPYAAGALLINDALGDPLHLHDLAKGSVLEPGSRGPHDVYSSLGVNTSSFDSYLHSLNTITMPQGVPAMNKDQFKYLMNMLQNYPGVLRKDHTLVDSKGNLTPEGKAFVRWAVYGDQTTKNYDSALGGAVGAAAAEAAVQAEENSILSIVKTGNKSILKDHATTYALIESILKTHSGNQQATWRAIEKALVGQSIIPDMNKAIIKNFTGTYSTLKDKMEGFYKSSITDTQHWVTQMSAKILWLAHFAQTHPIDVMSMQTNAGSVFGGGLGNLPAAMKPWKPDIMAASKATGLPPAIIAGIMSVESGGVNGQTSSKGAMGLMQLMPGTYAQYGRGSPWSGQNNIMAGARYFQYLLNGPAHGDYTLALEMYNAGPNSNNLAGSAGYAGNAMSAAVGFAPSGGVPLPSGGGNFLSQSPEYNYINQAGQHDTDFKMNYGTPVRLPIALVFKRRWYVKGIPWQSQWKIPKGGTATFVHLSVAYGFSAGKLYPAGTVIGMSGAPTDPKYGVGNQLCVITDDQGYSWLTSSDQLVSAHGIDPPWGGGAIASGGPPHGGGAIASSDPALAGFNLSAASTKGKKGVDYKKGFDIGQKLANTDVSKYKGDPTGEYQALQSSDAYWEKQYHQGAISSSEWQGINDAIKGQEKLLQYQVNPNSTLPAWLRAKQPGITDGDMKFARSVVYPMIRRIVAENLDHLVNVIPALENLRDNIYNGLAPFHDWTPGQRKAARLVINEYIRNNRHQLSLDAATGTNRKGYNFAESAINFILHKNESNKQKLADLSNLQADIRKSSELGIPLEFQGHDFGYIPAGSVAGADVAIAEAKGVFGSPASKAQDQKRAEAEARKNHDAWLARAATAHHNDPVGMLQTIANKAYTLQEWVKLGYISSDYYWWYLHFLKKDKQNWEWAKKYGLQGYNPLKGWKNLGKGAWVYNPADKIQYLDPTGGGILGSNEPGSTLPGSSGGYSITTSTSGGQTSYSVGGGGTDPGSIGNIGTSLQGMVQPLHRMTHQLSTLNHRAWLMSQCLKTIERDLSGKGHKKDHTQKHMVEVKTPIDIKIELDGAQIARSHQWVSMHDWGTVISEGVYD